MCYSSYDDDDYYFYYYYHYILHTADLLTWRWRERERFMCAYVCIYICMYSNPQEDRNVIIHTLFEWEFM